MGDNSAKKKKDGFAIFIRNPYMKFQDSSFKGLKVTVGRKKCDPRPHARLKKQYAPSSFSKLGT